MSRMFGTVVRGVRAPIFREGDDVVKGTVDTVLKALKENSVEPHDKDVVAITDSVVARTQGNYATVEQIAADVKARTGGKTVGVTFPILSRNRFSVLLSGIAAGCNLRVAKDVPIEARLCKSRKSPLFRGSSGRSTPKEFRPLSRSAFRFPGAYLR